MRTLACLLVASTSLLGGELVVTAPNDGFGSVLVQSLSDKQDIKNPEATVDQEQQILIYDFKDLEPGKYRVSYICGLNPLGFLATVMETHIEVANEHRRSVFLFQPWPRKGPELPLEVRDYLMEHRENFLELRVSYDGSDQTFDLTRGRLADIGSLRSDCHYHIVVWDHTTKTLPANRKIIYEKKFRAVPPNPDPFTK